MLLWREDLKNLALIVKTLESRIKHTQDITVDMCENGIKFNYNEESCSIYFETDAGAEEAIRDILEVLNIKGIE